MAIFSRRILQRIIDENAKFLTEGQVRNHVRQLNNQSIDLTLAYEWEIVLINAFSKAGKVEHEKNFGGSKNADIYYEDYKNSDINFLVDITTISDKGLDTSNPFDALFEDLRKIVNDIGLNAGSFNLEVGRHEGSVYKGGTEKVRLKLPGRARFPQVIFNNNFYQFIGEIKQNPSLKHRYEIANADADVVISYDPTQEYSFGNYPSYYVFHSVTHNRVYSALEEKARQLSETNFKGPCGIILCDGGFHSFNEKWTAGLSYRFDEIINHFLQKNEDINFVATFTSKSKQIYPFPFHRKPEYEILFNFYRGLKYGSIDFNINEIFSTVHRYLPIPEREPINAISFLKFKKHEGSSFYGGGQVSASRLKMSARAFLDLLAGKINPEQFRKDHDFFMTALTRGQLIEKVYIEKCESKDDDWMVFEFKGPDPAISPFKMPD